jgi:hypothetical protein
MALAINHRFADGNPLSSIQTFNYRGTHTRKTDGH